jgi:hypothetical protein
MISRPATNGHACAMWLWGKVGESALAWSFRKQHQVNKTEALDLKDLTNLLLEYTLNGKHNGNN